MERTNGYMGDPSLAMRSQFGGMRSAYDIFGLRQIFGAQTILEGSELSHAPHHDMVLFAMMLCRHADINRRSSWPLASSL